MSTLIPSERLRVRTQVRHKHSGIHADESWNVGDVLIERFGACFIASEPRIGALSTLTTADLIPFTIFLEVQRDERAAAELISRFLGGLDGAGRDSKMQAEDLLRVWHEEGWFRTSFPIKTEEPLVAIYFTLTRACDRACPYCYQGLANRNDTLMRFEHAIHALDAIHGVNPNCELIFTGGEPLLHPNVFEILHKTEDAGHAFTVLTNGSFVDDNAAQQFASFRKLRFVQISLDGFSEATHAKTRGPRHFARVMDALEKVIKHSVPFVLAPTMHAGNLHEVYEVARLAVRHGGWCKPNILHKFPHEGLDFDGLTVSDADCWSALVDMNTRLSNEFSPELMSELGGRFRSRESCSVTSNAHSICGMGFSLLDLDWNGDIYPCHLTKARELILGNLFTGDTFETAFARARSRRVRVPSNEIGKCSSCKFVSTCGGGCRANAWFEFGSVAREDSQCELNYSSWISKSTSPGRDGCT